MGVRVEGVEVRLAGRAIVRGIDLHMLGPGWFGVMGANGGGKTTLLRALCGRLPISAGRVWIGGEEVASDPGRRARLISDAAPCESLPAGLTAAELIELTARARRVSPAGGDLRGVLEIDRLRDTPVAAMSSGMRQRLALHLAFLGDPAVVLLDEPFNWLDPVVAFDVKEQLGRWARSSILITALHDVATFATWCTSGLLLRDGAVGRVFGDADLRRAMSDMAAFERDIYQTLKGDR